MSSFYYILAMLPLKPEVLQNDTKFCTGARRSFFCRMKCKISTQVKEEADTTTGCYRRRKQNSGVLYATLLNFFSLITNFESYKDINLYVNIARKNVANGFLDINTFSIYCT